MSLYRAWLTCSSYELLHVEICKLRDIFIENSYPRNYFDRILNDFLCKKFSDCYIVNEIVQPKFILKIPFIEKHSVLFRDRLTKIFKNHLNVDISCIFSSLTVGSYFSLKSRTPKPLLSNVIYKFSCLRDVSLFYIGKTKRHLTVRVKEHCDLSKNSMTAVKQHILSCETCFNSDISIDNFEILSKCANDYSCKVTEALFIKDNKPSLNKQLHNSGASFLLNVF